MNPRANIVIVGNSVRYLAQSAHAAGVAVTAVDGFGDADTRAASTRFQRAHGLSPRRLLDAARDAMAGHGSDWVYGAGFESGPSELLALARQNRHVVGNDPSTLQLLGDPARLFSLLQELDIPHPETRLEAAGIGTGWLLKPAGGYGGLGVRLYAAVRPQAVDESAYLQRFVNGTLCSLLFVADGADLEVIGFNRMLVRYPAAGDFRFAGVINGFSPEDVVKRGMLTAARRLTRALGLRGVNGIDFVIHQGRPLLIDLNARPTAALELYENALPLGGYLCHVAACQGELTPTPVLRGVHGMRIVYTRQALCITDVEWPEWVTDRPMRSEFIPADQPLCTVHAQGADMATVDGRLRERVDSVYQLLAACNECAA